MHGCIETVGLEMKSRAKTGTLRACEIIDMLKNKISGVVDMANYVYSLCLDINRIYIRVTEIVGLEMKFRVREGTFRVK